MDGVRPDFQFLREIFVTVIRSANVDDLSVRLYKGFSWLIALNV